MLSTWKEVGIFNIRFTLFWSWQVFASLVYADTGAPVENTSEDEAPLLCSYDGIEFSSFERPSKFVLGRASFKLRISQVKIPCTKHCFYL
jgi:hypothetical protein